MIITDVDIYCVCVHICVLSMEIELIWPSMK